MTFQFLPIDGVGDIVSGDRMGQLLGQHFDFQGHDVVVVSSKAVAKAEGRRRDIEEGSWDQLVASQSRRILRRRGDLVISETHTGLICANAGIDRSNTEPGTAVLLPKDPDRSAHVIRNEIAGQLGIDVAVIVIDTQGRAWRRGAIDVAIGCAGIAPIDDQRRQLDAFERPMASTEIAVVDQLAAAVGLFMAKASRRPAVVVRGLDKKHFGTGSIAADVTRPYNDDMFR